jgi:hypothetical protein
MEADQGRTLTPGWSLSLKAQADVYLDSEIDNEIMEMMSGLQNTRNS